MEYCEGGDLFTRITSGTLTNAAEYNWYVFFSSCRVNGILHEWKCKLL
jgi:hypothetical protein